MSNLIHKLQHKLGWNKGNPESHYEGEDLIMCFRCECGELSECHNANYLLEETK